jgi:hypothetical protein
MFAKEGLLDGVDQVSESLNVQRPERLNSAFQIKLACATAHRRIHHDPQREEGNGNETPGGNHACPIIVDQSLSTNHRRPIMAD